MTPNALYFDKSIISFFKFMETGRFVRSLLVRDGLCLSGIVRFRHHFRIGFRRSLY